MLNINTNKKNNFILKAISSKHDFTDFQDFKKPYSIFNPNYNEYYVIIDENLNSNELFRAITKFVSGQTRNSFDIDLNSFISLVKENEVETLIQVMVDAIEYASVVPWSKNASLNEKQITHNIVIDNKYLDLVNEYNVVSKDRTFVRSLQDMPSNLINPEGFEKRMLEHLKNLDNVKITVLNEQDLKSNNMNLLLAVGAGSQENCDKSRLILVEYMPNPQDKNNTIGFVGKGVCFDTGGLNIKTGPHMRWMKYDMSGAAIVGSLIHSLAVNKIKKNVIAVMPLVLNLVDNASYRPDDVLISHNGLSVEIDNTDAEGRLILADAISYIAKDKKVKEIYDVATLTGAMIYALGDTYTGVWTNNEEIWNEVQIASNQSGELVWRLPFHHDFKDLLKSKFADIANSVSDARGGSSRAAMFLKEFTNNLPYTHFDVAATADKGNVGTGIMLHTFYNIVKNKKN